MWKQNRAEETPHEVAETVARESGHDVRPGHFSEGFAERHFDGGFVGDGNFWSVLPSALLIAARRQAERTIRLSQPVTFPTVAGAEASIDGEAPAKAGYGIPLRLPK